jgi:RNA polymerase sigma-70 factor (ECF subfamily)
MGTRVRCRNAADHFPTTARRWSSTDQVTDEQLAALARDGDLAAYGVLVTRHRAAVVRAALAALGDRAEAEDVAQETFVACHRALGGFRAESSVRTWLVAAAWRRALSRRRSLARWWTRGPLAWGESNEDGAAGHEPLDTGPSPEQRVIDADGRRQLRRLVRALPARLRDPLLLAASGQWSMAEIAGLVGVPEGTVKWRIAEARRLLKAKLARVAQGQAARRGALDEGA